MKEFTIEVKQTIKVTLDETRFTPEFFGEFKQSFYDYNTLEDHAKHIAQLEARGFINSENEFIEGYGPIKEMGITVEHECCNEIENITVI